MRIGIDLMGCDTPPKQLYQAVLQAAEDLDPSYTLIVLATDSVIEEAATLNHSAASSSKQIAKIKFFPIKEVITMGDEPLSAIRHKKNSSLVTGIRLLKKHQLDAFVSAGNTGALIASSTLSLPLLPGIKRPALLAVIPSERGNVVVIDVGGNVSCKARHLIQFAKLGAAYQRSIEGIESPRVGLLNIGVESKKGTSELRQAYQWLEDHREQLSLSFHGNIEGREIFQGAVDVVVTDGFTGNVLLKSIEGVSSFILDTITQDCGSNPGMGQALEKLQKRFNYAEYPGAIVCGIDRVVVKCHGNSTPTAFLNSIRGAAKLVQHQFVEKIKQQLIFDT